jgi:formylglycine-generating enzyme required for sulfatase activity
MAKVALLIGVSDYQIDGSSQGFINLPSTELDIAGMKKILDDPELGAFDTVTPLINPVHYEMSEAIETFLGNCSKEDLVLLYFSGHGAKDKNRKLYFAAKGTKKNAKDELYTATAVSAQFVRGLLDDCKSTKKIMILDCCFSGAIDPNAKGDDTLDVLTASLSAAKGSIILTSSSSTEISYGSPTQMSFYTRYFVEGIESGKADRDVNGHLSINELHNYVKDQLQVEKATMNPQIFFLKEDGFYDAPLIKVPIADPGQVYRKRIREYIDSEVERQGEFDPFTKKALEDYFNDIKRSSKIEFSLSDAEAIENELLQPIKQRLRNREEYRAAFRERLEKQDLNQYRAGLKRWRETTLKLADTDVEDIEREEQQRIADRKPAPAPTPVPAPEKPPAEKTTQSVQKPNATPQSEPLLKLSPFTFECATGVEVKSELLGLKKQVIVKKQSKTASEYLEDLSQGAILHMVAIPGDSFVMGAPESEGESQSSERPRHKVEIKPVLIGKYPVTQKQWRAVAALPQVDRKLDPNPSNFKGDDLPVEQVSWYGAIEFCARLSRKTQRDYRLPSEAEWEYACRARTTTPFYFGETITPDLVNYDSNYPYGGAPKGEYRQKTTPVGSFLPNQFGLYDMHGNVWE